MREKRKREKEGWGEVFYGKFKRTPLMYVNINSSAQNRTEASTSLRG
jgi:hypothetical protein